MNEENKTDLKLKFAQKSPSETHKNHRKRLRERFMNNPSSLTKHELVELLLFYSIPRSNTNPIAHALIDNYVSLNELLHANAKDLMQINGLGERSATFLTLIGKLTDVIAEEKCDEIVFYSYDRIKDYLINLYKNRNEEVFSVFFLGKDDRILKRKTFSSGSPNSVQVKMIDFMRETSVSKAASAVIAHNHPSGNPMPSIKDDEATESFYIILAAAQIRLYDHLIIGKDAVYSYRNDERLSLITKKFES